MDEITYWLNRLKEKDSLAAYEIWKSYYSRLVVLARRKLAEAGRTVQDEEDVAQSALNSFFRGVHEGRFPKLDDRDDLWKVLLTITSRKAVRQNRKLFAQKRGGPKDAAEGSLDHEPGASEWLDQHAKVEPTPSSAMLMAETVEELLVQLDGDDRLRTIALMKLEGYENTEIAERLGCVTRTVERKLALIRAIWQKHIS